MKITMTNLDNGGVLIDEEGEDFTQCVTRMIQAHTRYFGDEYLWELLEGLAVLAKGEETEYRRLEFSDPEANFLLKVE